MICRIFTTLVLALFPLISQAWWNEEWAFRKQMTLDTSATGANITEPLTNVPVLVRLHTGNFGYFLDLSINAEDIRFIAADDVTPLKFHIEKYDALNEMALIWVQIPELQAATNTQSFWMYYGNPMAVAGGEPQQVLDINQVLAYHFDGDVPKDATAYGNNPSLFQATVVNDALIANGLSFDGSQSLVIPPKPALTVDLEKGWTWSSWVKVDAPQPEGGSTLLQLTSADGAGQLVVGIDGMNIYAGVDAGTGLVETARNTALAPGAWQHIAVTLQGQRLSLYLAGEEKAFLETAIPAFNGTLTIGAATEQGGGFVGAIDEMQVSNVARPVAWIQAAVMSQGLGNMVIYGEDGAQEGSGGGTSYMTTILSNVAFDGWVVVIALAIMSVISWLVMVTKAVVLKRMRKDNGNFMREFASLRGDEIAELDAEDSEEDRELSESPLLMALSDNHDHYQSSPIYRVYHAGIQEIMHRMPKSVGAKAVHTNLSPQAINAIKATLDSAMTRENQKLNSQMVLLTIAISGGPFLGLLGTVLGVMITFAAIAASGEVNVNAIAPGTAAALFTTVAGLFVAIPALFGYNYLGSQIKEVAADMRVFVDEFVAKIAEQHS